MTNKIIDNQTTAEKNYFLLALHIKRNVLIYYLKGKIHKNSHTPTNDTGNNDDVLIRELN